MIGREGCRRKSCVKGVDVLRLVCEVSKLPFFDDVRSDRLAACWNTLAGSCFASNGEQTPCEVDGTSVLSIMVAVSRYRADLSTSASPVCHPRLPETFLPPFFERRRAWAGHRWRAREIWLRQQQFTSGDGMKA